MMLVAMERDEIIERVLQEREKLAERVRLRHEALSRPPPKYKHYDVIYISVFCRSILTNHAQRRVDVCERLRSGENLALRIHLP